MFRRLMGYCGRGRLAPEPAPTETQLLDEPPFTAAAAAGAAAEEDASVAAVENDAPLTPTRRHADVTPEPPVHAERASPDGDAEDNSDIGAAAAAAPDPAQDVVTEPESREPARDDPAGGGASERRRSPHPQQSQQQRPAWRALAASARSSSARRGVIAGHLGRQGSSGGGRASPAGRTALALAISLRSPLVVSPSRNGSGGVGTSGLESGGAAGADGDDAAAAARARLVTAGAALGASEHTARRGRIAELLVARDVAAARAAGDHGHAAAQAAVLQQAKVARKEAAEAQLPRLNGGWSAR
jgi:hypothetical protein